MAGSGSRPLTNIPYCCLPQESGPCLSTSVGDRPLRSPSHRRLGGPSPRQQANGTHARPRPRLRFATQGMPPAGRMPYYPPFPAAVRLTGVGCIRVTHPSATLNPPKGILPFDLHVLGLPLAFILSQDQTLRCTIAFQNFLLRNLGSAMLRSASRGTSSVPSGSFSRRPQPHGCRDASCAGLKLSKNSRKPLTPLPPLGCGLQKYHLFTKRQAFPQTFFRNPP